MSEDSQTYFLVFLIILLLFILLGLIYNKDSFKNVLGLSQLQSLTVPQFRFNDSDSDSDSSKKNLDNIVEGFNKIKVRT